MLVLGKDKLSLWAPADHHLGRDARPVGALAAEQSRLDPDDVYGEVVSAGLERLRTNGRISRTKVKAVS